MRGSGTLAALCLLLVSLPVFAAGLESFDFSGEVGEQRFKSLITELRCLVCQNQSLADSDAELAHDLRREVYEMMAAGRSDREIVDFLVARYGDFVLYNPPVKPETYVLWYGPFALLAAGLVMLVRTLRQRQRQRTPGLSAEEQARLKALLGDTTGSEGEDR